MIPLLIRYSVFKYFSYVLVLYLCWMFGASFIDFFDLNYLQMKKSDNALVVYLFRDHPGQPEVVEKQEKKKGKDAKQHKTVSSAFKAQLESLLVTLNQTDPHFIRCIVPNEKKTPGLLDSKLVLHQLTCNGVLEGIRICRRGFPNRTLYKEFKSRYVILNPVKMYGVGDNLQEGAKLILSEHEVLNDKWRTGHTKVFFKAGTGTKL